MNPYGHQPSPGGQRPPGAPAQGVGPPQMQQYAQFNNQGFPPQGPPQFPGMSYNTFGRLPGAYPMGRPISLPRPPGQMMYPQRPPSFRPPVGFPPSGTPMQHAPPMAPLPKPSTTLYVGKIATTVDEEFLRSVLEVCGPLKSWKRAADPTSGKPKGFGFAEYETAEGVLRAMRLLKDFPLDGQELLVNVNDATRLYLEHYNAAKKLQKAGSEEQPEIVIEDEEGDEGGKDTKEGESAEGQKGGEAKAAAGAGHEMEVDGKRGAEKVSGEEDEDLEARGKLEEMVKERAKTLPPPPPSPSIAEFIAKARDAAEDAEKADSGSRRGDSEGPSTSEKERPRSSHEHRSSRFSRDKRDPEDEMMRERERERARARRERERERERTERDADRVAEEREKELEGFEKERERDRRREKERERELEKERKAQVKDEEEEADEEDGTRKRRSRESGEEKRKRLQREREEDELDRLLEDKEIREAKRLRAIEEIEMSTRREEPPAPTHFEPPVAHPPVEYPPSDYVPVIQSPPAAPELLEPPPEQNGFSRLKSEPLEEERGVSPAARKPPGKKRLAASVFGGEEDEHKETRSRPLVPIEYTPEELAAAKAAAAAKALAAEKERASPKPVPRQPSPALPPAPALPPNLAAAAEFAKSLGKGGEAKAPGKGGEEKRKREEGRRSEKEQKDRSRDKGGVKLLDTKQLIDSIPKTKAELFAHPVEWSIFDSEKIHDKMRPWIGKKIAEFLGEEESTLVDFILQSMLKHDSAEKMLELLEPLLDEEAELFVLKMWRMLIFELKRAEQEMIR